MSPTTDKEGYVTGRIHVRPTLPMISCDVNADIIAETLWAVIGSISEESLV